MAHDKSIDELERDVEQARARVAADIAMLRAPETYEAAKSGLMDAAFGYRDQVRDRATGYGEGMIDTLKAKAAANPLAVAAIGAGIAWRLYKHPPVTTALVGLGLASLLRTDPNDDSMHPRRLMEAASEKAMEFKERAAAHAHELRETAVGALEERVHEWKEAAEVAYETAAERVSAVSEKAVERAAAVGEKAVERATAVGEEVVKRAAAVGEKAAERVSALGSSPGNGAQPSFSQTGDPEALGVRAHSMRAPTADIPYPGDDMRSFVGSGWGGERRDAYLLGLAALAVGAAVGLSRMRGAHDVEEDVGADDFDDGRNVNWRRY